jgi:hypothetical protein
VASTRVWLGCLRGVRADCGVQDQVFDSAAQVFGALLFGPGQGEVGGGGGLVALTQPVLRAGDEQEGGGVGEGRRVGAGGDQLAGRRAGRGWTSRGG